MTTEAHAWVSAHATTTQARTASAVCGCGQDLDVCAGSHCPRCGTRFARTRHEVAWHPAALRVQGLERSAVYAA
jgi:hypothetical protein